MRFYENIFLIKNQNFCIERVTFQKIFDWDGHIVRYTFSLHIKRPKKMTNKLVSKTNTVSPNDDSLQASQEKISNLLIRSPNNAHDSLASMIFRASENVCHSGEEY